ncbi:MAG: SH3 domain-containing C40 family peptidase [Bacteroidota bacterium]
MEIKVIAQSTACLRAEPKHASELVSQTGMGTPVEVLERNANNWLKIRVPDGYEAWAEPKAFGNTEFLAAAPSLQSAFSGAPHAYFMVKPPYCFADFTAGRINLVAGNILRLKSAKASALESNSIAFLMPDSQTCYLQAQDIIGPVAGSGLNAFNNSSSQAGKATGTVKVIPMVETAVSFTGVPYLWGGTCPRAFDCSGLVQFSINMQGLIFPRDAKDQALIGEERDISDKKTANLQTGDLLFFGEQAGRITHVAVYLGSGLYVHASGMVQTNSLHESHPLFEPYRFATWQGARNISGTALKTVFKSFEEFSPAIESSAK